MEVFKDIVEKLKDPAFKWKVPSVSNWGSYHKISFDDKLGWECDCVGYKMSGKKRNCKHIKLVNSKYGRDKVQGVQSNLTIYEDR